MVSIFALAVRKLRVQYNNAKINSYLPDPRGSSLTSESLTLSSQTRKGIQIDALLALCNHPYT